LKKALVLTYGFVANPQWPIRKNVAAVICDMPPWLYYSRPSNLSFHNLCLPTFSPSLPPGLKSLLGLGLNFCPRPQHSNGKNDVGLTRFNKDCQTRMFFAGSPPPESKSGLFIRSDWKPDTNEIPVEFRARLSLFIKSTHPLYRRKPSPSSLLPPQKAALRWLTSHSNVIVFPTDKNLGPAIMERDRYIQRALDEHLSDTKTYRQLDKTTADRRIKTIRIILKRIISDLKAAGLGSDATFLQRSTIVEDPYPYFYLLAKVHKQPLKTRPIVSVSGSILHGLGRWVDYVLQTICKQLPYRASSSQELVRDLRQLGPLPPTAQLFTCDATSMYTNIDTVHALALIDGFLKEHPAFLTTAGVPHDVFMRSLRTIMTHNVFRFGDTYWIQLSGTAMGAPPAPMYATLYFGILEQRLVPSFPQCLFYRRYIDDGLGIWIPPADPNEQRIFEKALNLYLYLPPHSCHPPGILKGLICGMMLRFFRLSSSIATAHHDVKRLLQRLVARGYSPSLVNEIMRKALNRISATPLISTTPTRRPKPLFFHVPYHPLDPPSSSVHRIYDKTLDRPPGEPPLATLRNRHGVPFGPSRFIVAFSRPSNLGNLLSPRKLSPPGISPSDLLKKLQADADPGTINPNPTLTRTGTRTGTHSDNHTGTPTDRTGTRPIAPALADRTGTPHRSSTSNDPTTDPVLQPNPTPTHPLTGTHHRSKNGNGAQKTN